MARPIKWRRVCCLPEKNTFGPLDSPPNAERCVTMTIDEYETIRLIDFDGFTQEECAKQMNVARTTIQGIYSEARKKPVSYTHLDVYKRQLYALIVFVVADYITGVLCAINDKKLSSEVGFKGIAKKVLIFVLVGIGNIIDVSILKEGSAIRTAVIFFYLSNEGISILENSAHLGLPIPKALKLSLIHI